MCCIWIAAPRFAAASCCSRWAFVGGGWRPRGQTGSRAQASIMPARRSKPTFTTAPTSRSSAAATRPGKPSCFWPNAARRARSMRSFAASWDPACRNICAIGSGQRANVVVHEQTEIDAVSEIAAWKKSRSKSQREPDAATAAVFGRVRLHRGRAVGGVAAGGNRPRRQRLSADRDRRGSFRALAPRGSRPLPAGDHLPGVLAAGDIRAGRPSASASRWATARWP